MKAVILNKFSKSSFCGAEYDFGRLLPVAGKSVADYIVKNLKKSGVKDIFICGRPVLGYTDGALYEYGKLGVNVCEVFDRNYFMKDSVIVVESVGICEALLGDMIDYHMKKRALITCLQNKNSEKGIIENTGIYIIEPAFLHLIDEISETASLGDITARKKMSEYGKRILNYEIFDSWYPVDDKNSFTKANLSMIKQGKIYSEGRFIREGVFAGKNSMVSGSALLMPPVMIGSNTIIGSGCKISESVIGNDVILESDVTVESSVLLSNISAGNRISIKNSVVSGGVTLRDSFSAEDCVIGRRSICKEASSVMSGARVTCDTVVEKGCSVKSNTDDSRADVPEFDEYGLKFDFCRKHSPPEILAKLGGALGTFYGFTSTVVVGCDSDDFSMMSARALTSGLMFSGVNVKILNDTVLPVMRWVCRRGLADGGVYISGSEKEKIYILNNRGNDITTRDRRRFEKIYSCNEITDVPQNYTGKTEAMANPEEFYTAHITEMFPEAYRCLQLDMKTVKEDIKDIVCAVFTSEMFPEAPVFVPRESYLAVSKILGERANIIRCGANRGDVMAEMERFMGIPGVYQQYLMMFDDFAFELAVSHFKAVYGLEKIRKIVIPRIYRKSVFIGCDKYGENDFYDYLAGNKYIRKNFEVGESLLRNSNDGCVSIMKNSARSGIEINVESYREEYAAEITGEIDKIFREYSGKK